MADPDRSEDLAQLIVALKDQYGVSESEIARRIGVHVSTVNNWVHRKRGSGRGPNPNTLRKLAETFPAFTVERVFAAAGRKTPGPLSPDARDRLLALFEELTEEQQTLIETQVRAVVEGNRSSTS